MPQIQLIRELGPKEPQAKRKSERNFVCQALSTKSDAPNWTEEKN